MIGDGFRGGRSYIRLGMDAKMVWRGSGDETRLQTTADLARQFNSDAKGKDEHYYKYQTIDMTSAHVVVSDPSHLVFLPNAKPIPHTFAIITRCIRGRYGSMQQCGQSEPIVA